MEKQTVSEVAAPDMNDVGLKDFSKEDLVRFAKQVDAIMNKLNPNAQNDQHKNENSKPFVYVTQPEIETIADFGTFFFPISCEQNSVKSYHKNEHLHYQLVYLYSFLIKRYNDFIILSEQERAKFTPYVITFLVGDTLAYYNHEANAQLTLIEQIEAKNRYHNNFTQYREGLDTLIRFIFAQFIYDSNFIYVNIWSWFDLVTQKIHGNCSMTHIDKLKQIEMLGKCYRSGKENDPKKSSTEFKRTYFYEEIVGLFEFIYPSLLRVTENDKKIAAFYPGKFGDHFLLAIKLLKKNSANERIRYFELEKRYPGQKLFDSLQDENRKIMNYHEKISSFKVIIKSRTLGHYYSAPNLECQIEAHKNDFGSELDKKIHSSTNKAIGQLSDEFHGEFVVSRIEKTRVLALPIHNKILESYFNSTLFNAFGCFRTNQSKAQRLLNKIKNYQDEHAFEFLLNYFIHFCYTAGENYTHKAFSTHIYVSLLYLQKQIRFPNAHLNKPDFGSSCGLKIRLHYLEKQIKRAEAKIANERKKKEEASKKLAQLFNPQPN